MPGAEEEFDLDAALAGDTSMEDDASPAPPKKETANAAADAGDTTAPPKGEADTAAERTDPSIRVAELSAGGGESPDTRQALPPPARPKKPQEPPAYVEMATYVDFDTGEEVP